MRTLLQLATLIALAVDVASTILLYWTSQSAAQDAAGRGMAGGFLWLALAAMAAAVVLLLISYARRSTSAAIFALLLAVIPSIPIVLPSLV